MTDDDRVKKFRFFSTNVIDEKIRTEPYFQPQNAPRMVMLFSQDPTQEPVPWMVSAEQEALLMMTAQGTA